MSIAELKTVLFSGGNIVISAKDFSTTDLMSLAMTAKIKTGKITILNASVLSIIDCKAIAVSGGEGTVTFVFN